MRRGDGVHRDAGRSKLNSGGVLGPPSVWLRLGSRRLRIVADGLPGNVVHTRDRDVAFGIRCRDRIRIPRAGHLDLREASSGAPSGRSASCFAKRPPGSSRSSGPGSSFIRGTMPGAASSKPGCTGRGAWGSSVARRRRLRKLDLRAALLDELPARASSVRGRGPPVGPRLPRWHVRRGRSRHWRVYRPERSLHPPPR